MKLISLMIELPPKPLLEKLGRELRRRLVLSKVLHISTMHFLTLINSSDTVKFIRVLDCLT